uniref:Uncharacterized protein n=1 Tax=Trypanosoma congolense (strain IL3000) TaxID=1068625 RepID=G0V1N9_TRYCI|nr:hypothetical protein, unlikely [Trypanosoma congolense IL3000]
MQTQQAFPKTQYPSIYYREKECHQKENSQEASSVWHRINGNKQVTSLGSFFGNRMRNFADVRGVWASKKKNCRGKTVTTLLILCRVCWPSCNRAKGILVCGICLWSQGSSTK